MSKNPAKFDKYIYTYLWLSGRLLENEFNPTFVKIKNQKLKIRNYP